MLSVNVFAVANGVGISRDIELIKDVLTAAGHEVEINPMYRYQPTRKFDVNIFVERFNQRWLELAKYNCFIPNQEWFEAGWMPYLKRFDLYLTKTKFADTVFKNLGVRTEYVSFTSIDRFLPNVGKDDLHWLHVAGKSVQKQTETVIRTWARNPGFPQLTILQDPKYYKPRTMIKNINFMFDRLPDDTLKHLQNAFAVHVCPSETEGFGHYIMEGLSCEATVLTTGGAPMSELVTEERGVLVDPVRAEPMRLSTRYIVSEMTLEKAVAKTLVLDDHRRRELGKKGREFFLENDSFFRRRLPEAINGLFA
jgi:hypothetical protein